MKTIKYRIAKRRKEHSISVDEILERFSKSKEAENYTKYHYSFNTCMCRFLMDEIVGIQKLSDGQLSLLETEFNNSEQ